MSRLVFAIFLLPGGLWADSTLDRAAIESVVKLLNVEQPELPAGITLFTSDIDQDELKRLRSWTARVTQMANRVMSEMTKPFFAMQSVRFVASDVALVDVIHAQYGSLVYRRIPVLLVMKKEGTEWRIASVRFIAELFQELSTPTAAL